MFYESDPLMEMPVLELPSLQYGSMGLPGTTFRRNNFSLAETLRPFLWSNYAPYLFVCPRTSVINAQAPAGILAFQSYEDRITLQPGSFLVGWSAYSSQAAGFRFQLYDVGAQDYVLTDKWQNWTDAEAGDTAESVPHLLPDPYVVVSPGQLLIKVVNLATVTNDFQMVLHFCSPKVRQ
jgi:hypothetical protein